MKILFVFTGGTIGSTLQNDNVIATDPLKAYKILKAYSKKYPIDFEYDIAEPYTELSENNTGEHIRMLSECIGSRLDLGYDGIVITHGTDTLQYSAAAVGYMLGANSLPVCLVSANYPIEDERSNALDNLHGAICLIRSKAGRGAFVVYRNGNSDTVRVHRATRLTGVKAFSDDVSSIFGNIYGRFDDSFSFVKNPKYVEKNDAMETIAPDKLSESSKEIMMVYPYTGMAYPVIRDGVKYIILNTYHSGTLNTKSQSVIDFLAEAKEKGITVYVTGVSDGAEYESATSFSKLGLIPLRNIAPIAAYVKLWILSQNNGTEKITHSLAGDVVPAECI